jgi:hypothetical protein
MTMKQFVNVFLILVLSTVLAFSRQAAPAGVQAELRSSTALLPALGAGMVTATAPAGGVVIGAQALVCDASQGFTQIVNVENGIADPFLAIGTGGVHLPISPTNVPATCGQMAYDGNGNVYITQAVVDTKNTPSIARGILRETVDPQTGAVVGAGSYIATTAGLDGNQPTAAAIGPDGDLYVGFLKSGNIKRIVNPGVGNAQVVQSVGNTPSGHPARALAFVGNDLYIGSADAFSVIRGATSSACTGGCNAAVLADGFSGVPHVGVTSDGVDAVYFAMSGNNQIWRYSVSGNAFAFVAQGGADRNGNNASNFSFVAAKTNLLALDAGGNLWIGDDTSGGTAVDAGRIWTISSLSLGTIPGGNAAGGGNTQAILNVLHGPWETLIGSTIFVPTFNADGTFTAVITSGSGAITTTSGTWVLTPPIRPSGLANPEGNLTLTDTNGVVVLTGDVLLIKADQIFMQHTTGSVSPDNPVPIQIIITKMTA